MSRGRREEVEDVVVIRGAGVWAWAGLGSILRRRRSFRKYVAAFQAKGSSREKRGDRDESVKGGNPIRRGISHWIRTSFHLSVYLSLSFCPSLSRFLSVILAIYFSCLSIC